MLLILPLKSCGISFFLPVAGVPCRSSFSDDLLSPVVKWNFAFELKLRAYITLHGPRADRAGRAANFAFNV